MMDDDFAPKELLEINWKATFEDTEEFLNEEFWRKHSTTHKILTDVLTPIWSSDSEDEKKCNKPIENPQKKKKVPYASFSAYPKPSTLTVIQQEVFLALMKKFHNEHSPFLSPQEKKELQTYTVLQEKVSKEQVEYQQFLQEYAFANQSRYLSINPGIRKYINELWKSHLQIPLRYPQFYETYRTVPLVYCDLKGGFDMLPDEISLQLGMVDRLNPLKHFPNVITDYSIFVAKHPIVSQTEDSISKRIYPVSQDKNADHLVGVTNAEFVISSSGIKKICDNHGPLFQKSWELPVTVKEFEVKENGRTKTKKIIYIDKALPRKKMTVVDKINWFHKIAVKTALVKPNHIGAYRLHRPKRTGKSTADNDFLFTEEDHETFGIDASTSSEKTSARIVEPEEKASKEEAVKEDADEEDDPQAKIDKYVNSSDLSDSDEGNLVIEEETCNQESKESSHPKREVCKEGIKDDSPSKTTVVSPKSTPSTPKTSPTTLNKSSNSEEGNKKPLTRSMAKMLEKLNKVEKLVGKKAPNLVENSSVDRELTTDETTNSKSAVSPQKEKATIKQDEEESAVSLQKDRDKAKQEPNDMGGKKEEEEACPKVIKRGGKMAARHCILDQLLRDQSSLFGSDKKKKDVYQSREKRRIRKFPLLSDYDPVLPPQGTNLVYRVFTLGKKTHQGVHFKILVRCKYDATEFVGKVRMATIVPKVEFQPEFGAEATTISELTRHWLSLCMKPNSVLVRVRVDAFTGKILMVEQKEIKDLSREERFLNIQGSTCLNPLYSVLHGISDVPPGQYVLSHDSKLGAFARLYRAIEVPRDGSYDLHKQYDVDATVEEPQSIGNLWIPIDFGIITPMHDSTNRVPGTFNPVTADKAKKRKKKKSKKKT